MKYAVTVAKHSSIADLKVKLAELAGVAANELTLADIYQVRVLHCVCARVEAGMPMWIQWIFLLILFVYVRAEPHLDAAGGGPLGGDHSRVGRHLRVPNDPAASQAQARRYVLKEYFI